MISITIDFKDVFEAVRRSAEYLGQKNNAYDKLRVVEYDDEQMLQWFADGMVSVGNILDRLLAKRITTSFATGEAKLFLNISNNNSEQIKDCIESYVAAHMFRMWVEMVFPEYLEAPRYDEQERMRDLLQIAYYREMPR